MIRLKGSKSQGPFVKEIKTNKVLKIQDLRCLEPGSCEDLNKILDLGEQHRKNLDFH